MNFSIHRSATLATPLIIAALALSLAASVQAADQKVPLHGSFHSAKDPDLPPLPFNPHPELEVVEVEKGVFIVDDTAIPDTPEQAAARQARQAARERTAAIASDPVLAKAIQEAQQAALLIVEQGVFESEYAPWVVPDPLMPDGSPITWEALEAQNQERLLSLSTNIANDFVEKEAAVSLLLESNTNITPRWTDDNDNPIFIDSVDPLGAPVVKSLFNLKSAQTVAADKVWPGGSSGLNLDGTNVLIGEWDGGDVQTNHQEFWLGGFPVSLVGPATNGIGWHATHVAGTLAAWGGAPVVKGFANRAKVKEGHNRFDFLQMPGFAATNAMRVSNHSYGNLGGWYRTLVFGTNAWVWNGNLSISTTQDWHFGFYDDYARTNDQIIYTAQTYLPVFSAGNARGPGPYQPPVQPTNHWEIYTVGTNAYLLYTTAVRPLNDAQGGFNNLTACAVSKNTLVVGAVNPNTNGYTGTNSVVMSGFSSWGPTAEGRIKPDICAAGVSIVSTYATNQTTTNLYASASGTSQAAPAVTGTVGLLVGLHNRLYGTNYPPLLSSSLAGIVVHSADQAGTNIGPNYMFGWGQLNALAAATLISSNYASGSLAFIKEVRLTNGDYIEFPVVLTNNKPFKATIRWTDPPATPVAPAVNPTNRMLVNDLDLRTVSPSGVTNLPWVLSRTSPATGATQGDNSVDNVEQVSIPNPTSGTYQVRITHKGTLVNDAGQTSYQNVSILLSGNIAQPSVVPLITSIRSVTVSNTVALKWSSEVGRVYRVQQKDDISPGAWQFATGELSATKTNSAAVLSVAGTTNRFYRVVQVR